MMGKEEMAQLESAIAQLPEEYRTVIILREFSILTYEEIGNILNISFGHRKIENQPWTKKFFVNN